MRILITGAGGFVGGWLAHELANAYPDAVLWGMARDADTAALPARLTVRPADLNEPESLDALVAEAEPDIVFHLAGYASGAGTDREKIFRVNRDGTLNLLEALRKAERPCRVQIASSGYVYGDTTGRRARETDVPHPSGAYPESKAAMEEALHPFAGEVLQLTVTRSFNHTGPRQTTDFVIPAFAKQIARIEAGLEAPIVRHGNLDALRDFLHVADVVRAYRLLMCEMPNTEPLWLMNVCSGEGVAVRTLLEKLIAQSTVAITEEADPARLRASDLPECVGDPSRLQDTTGWTPEHSLEETLTETLNFWRQAVAQEVPGDT